MSDMTSTAATQTPVSSAAGARTRCSDISPGEAVETVLLLASAEKRSKKNGDPFFSLSLSDATGTIQGVMWDNHAALLSESARVGDFVRVEGFAAEYNGALQLTVRRLDMVPDSEVELSEFLAVSPRPREEMEAELDAHIASVENRDCRRLLDRLLGHPRLRELYCTAPAAAKVHQAYISGLLDHTLAVVKTALFLGESYKPFDRDVLLTAGLLHDIGKIREYDWRRVISYTDEGRLLGHISIGAAMIDGAMRALAREEGGFSPTVHQHILHCVLAHHGKLEYGSPVVPKTKEALLLHYADYTDAYLASYCDAIEAAQKRGQGWTPYNKMFGAFLYSGPPASAEGAVMPGPADVPATASEDPRWGGHADGGNLDGG